MKQKIAIPLTNNQLCSHFGKVEFFKIFEIENNSIITTSMIIAPPHEHGKLPQWIADQGITNIISGGIGQKAIALLHEHNITLIYGVEPNEPEILVQKFLENKLESGLNLCDH